MAVNRLPDTPKRTAPIRVNPFLDLDQQDPADAPREADDNVQAGERPFADDTTLQANYPVSPPPTSTPNNPPPSFGRSPIAPRDPTAEPPPPAPAGLGPMPTAADFTAERMLRPTTEPPRSGYRRLLFAITGGRLNLGPSRAELIERELIAHAKTPTTGCRHIAVASRKGGVGKTTTTLCLGHTFAHLRGDKIAALDGNPDAGSLGFRVPRETANTLTNLLSDHERITRYADVRAYTNQADSRLEVIAADTHPTIAQALSEDDYRTAVELLDRFYTLLLMDTGTGVLSSANRGILDLADQIIVVSGPGLDSARGASKPSTGSNKTATSGSPARPSPSSTKPPPTTASSSTSTASKLTSAPAAATSSASPATPPARRRRNRHRPAAPQHPPRLPATRSHRRRRLLSAFSGRSRSGLVPGTARKTTSFGGR
jgi:Mrp family chromosome partitioning ATPase